MILWISIVVACLLKEAIGQTPIVLWHGMGDDCCNPKSMGAITEIIHSHIPDAFVHSIRIGESESDDRNAGFFGVLNDQLEDVCEQLASIPELANGFHALGFSQGGLFLRAYIQRCNRPNVRNLITFGSPHGGVSDIPNCSAGDFKCALMRSMVRRGVYTSYVQHRVIQAQYFKDPNNFKGYLEQNIFLPDINNQGESQNATYRSNLQSLGQFVMIRFDQDTMIVPREAAWFWTLTDDEQDPLRRLQEQALYKEDWLGLRQLDENGQLHFLTAPGKHMEIAQDFFVDEVLKPYLMDQAVTKPKLLHQPV
ncbi:palmitoyl-protein thioesterase 1 [Hesseltinella vesiculosa]|uniref:Palmitoyl-protein thioesterase 1 n=1 Tax=Hesseltinella vesiculosa TaxID=101127 RepID=A0A1X2G3U5_9FUNG|nr:palmitoyl-protein thioesterase 1 [Hesseltinella vesiculosa]